MNYSYTFNKKVILSLVFITIINLPLFAEGQKVVKSVIEDALPYLIALCIIIWALIALALHFTLNLIVTQKRKSLLLMVIGTILIGGSLAIIDYYTSFLYDLTSENWQITSKMIVPNLLLSVLGGIGLFFASKKRNSDI